MGLEILEVAFWQDEERYSTRWLAVSPGNHLALISLAQQQERREKIDAALRHKPDLSDARVGLKQAVVDN